MPGSTALYQSNFAVIHFFHLHGQFLTLRRKVLNSPSRRAAKGLIRRRILKISNTTDVTRIRLQRLPGASISKRADEAVSLTCLRGAIVILIGYHCSACTGQFAIKV